MYILSLLYISAFYVYLTVGFISIRLFFRYRQNLNMYISLTLLCLSMGLWSLFYAFLVNAGSKEECWFFFKLSVPFLSFMPVFFLNFFHLLVCKMYLPKTSVLLEKWRYWIFVFTISLPGIIFTYRGLTDIFTVKDFIKTPLGWQSVQATGTLWYKLFLAYCFIYFTSCIIINIVWRIKAKIKRERKQANIILFFSLLILILNFVNEAILPSYEEYKFVPKLVQFITIMWVLAVVYAINRYHFMKLTPEIALDEIFSGMIDMLFLLDYKGIIYKINNRVELMLGYADFEIAGKPLIYYIKEEKIFNREFKRLENKQYSGEALQLRLKAKNNKEIFINMYIKGVYDSAGDLIGTVVVARDIGSLLLIQEEIEERKEAEKKLQLLNKNLEREISNRTRELEEVNKRLFKEVEERKRVNEQLFVAYRRLKSVLDLIPYAVVVIDIEGAIEDCNNILRDIGKRWGQENLIGKNILDYMNSSDKEYVKGKMGEIIEKGFVKDIEFVYTGKDGSKNKMVISATLIKDSMDKPSGFVALFKEIK